MRQTECTASSNTDAGIRIGYGSTLSGCTVYGNDVYGIRTLNDCRVVGNTCHSNGSGEEGAGIFVQEDDSRIEGNTVTGNSLGIYVEDAGNILFGNTASGNTTNYVIAAGNKVGEIVTAPDSPAISGSTGGSGLGTTNPWANFSF